MVNRALIDEAARRLGLATSEDTVVAKVAAEPGFRNQLGQFDRDLLRRALARVGWSEAEFMRQEKDNIVRSQLAEALSGGVGAPSAMIDPLVRWRQESRQADTVLVRSSAMPQPAPPEAAELERFYKTNANAFMAPEFRAVTALMLRTEDMAKPSEISEDMVAEAYKGRLEEFRTPERRTVSQVVLVDDGSAEKAGEMVGAGKDLAAIAKELNVSVIDLGTVERGDLPDELAGPVFAAAKGGLTPPVKSSLGWHVARVTDIAAEKVSPLTEVKAQLLRDLLHDKAADRLAELSNQVEDSLGGGATLEETATRLALPVLRVAAIDAQGRGPGGKPVANAPKDETFLDVAFHTEQGTESQLTEIDNDGLFLLRVDSVTPPQPRPLADVRAEAVAAWQMEQRQKAAAALADKIAARVKAGEPLTQVAQSQSLKVETTPPFTREGSEAAKLPPAIVTALFDGKPGIGASAPARDGVMVAQLTKIAAFDPQAGAKLVEQIRARISASLSADLVEQYIAALNDDIGVKVDRSQLAREE